MKLLLWTAEDPASARIAAALQRACAFEPARGSRELLVDLGLGAALARVEGPLLSADRADRLFEPPAGERFERALFLSRHSASSGQTALTVHPIGNLGPRAGFGGRPRTLSPPDPGHMTSLLCALAAEAKPLKIPATFEATHHGPAMEVPSLFVEVGSGPRDWENDTLARAVARAVLEGYLKHRSEEGAPLALGLGGGHYQPLQADAARREGAGFGHLIPAYALSEVDRFTLEAAAEQSRAERVLVDARGAEAALLERAQRILKDLGLRLAALRPNASPPPKL